ncbi:head-tail joining protein [Shimia sp.]|uniref:head-tail joining protein n=1 Tax=Shimia sp. TaxID=1954381 RepID=UPI003B8D0A47
MSHFFDGMAEVLGDTLGASVTIHPTGGEVRTIQAVVRDTTVEIDGEDGGPVVTIQPSMKARPSDVAGLEPGDRVVAAGVSYVVEYQEPRVRVAVDQFETFILRKDFP